MARERVDVLNGPTSTTEADSVFSLETIAGQPPRGAQAGGASRLKPGEGTPARHAQVLFDVRYTFIPGHVVLTPTGDDTQAGKVVKMHAGFWVREVTWTAEATNRWPDCPALAPTDPNEVVLDGSYIQPADPLEGPAGERIYRVSGFYRYRLLAPPFPLTAAGPFPTAVGGHTTATQADNSLPREALRPGMIGQVPRGGVPKSI